MPYAAPRICARCGALVARGQVCACRPAWEGGTHAGNTRRWRRLRLSKLRKDPICQHPGCRFVAAEVDHIVPLAQGGARYDWRNIQSLCRVHHIDKTVTDAQRGRRRAR